MEAETVKVRRRVRRRKWSDLELGMFLVAVLAALLMTISGIVGLVHMVSGTEDKPAEQKNTVTIGGDQQEKTAEGEEQAESTQEAEPVQDASLSQYAGDTGYGGSIYALLDDHPEAAYVLRNLDLYPPEILEFVIRFPEAMPYAAAYPDFTRTGIEQEIDLSDEAAQEDMPLLIQWDSRWGYAPYGDSLIGYSGCGPTCLSMVSIYLTGWDNNDPRSVANYAQENGHYTKGSGSAWTLMSDACEHFGLKSKELPLDENKIKEALDQDRPVVLSLGAGYFTDNGHYIVLCGYNDNGFMIRDPNSPENSAKVWAYEELKDQIKNIWAFERA